MLSPKFVMDKSMDSASKEGKKLFLKYKMVSLKIVKFSMTFYCLSLLGLGSMFEIELVNLLYNQREIIY